MRHSFITFFDAYQSAISRAVGAEIIVNIPHTCFNLCIDLVFWGVHFNGFS